MAFKRMATVYVSCLLSDVLMPGQFPMDIQLPSGEIIGIFADFAISAGAAVNHRNIEYRVLSISDVEHKKNVAVLVFAPK